MQEIKAALRSADPEQALAGLVLSWSKKGMTKQQIYDKLNKFLEQMQANLFTELDEEFVAQVLDKLSGWCDAGKALLPDEELSE